MWQIMQAIVTLSMMAGLSSAVWAQETLDLSLSCKGGVGKFPNQIYAEAIITFAHDGKAYAHDAFLSGPFDYTVTPTHIGLDTPRGCRIPLPEQSALPNKCNYIGWVNRETGEVLLSSIPCDGGCFIHTLYHGRCSVFKKAF